MKVIISSPSLDPVVNVSGVSSMTDFIIRNNTKCEYIHFEIGKRDETNSLVSRIHAVFKSIMRWKKILRDNPDALIHYNFPLSAPSIIRDSVIMRMALRRKFKMIIHIHGGIYLTSPKIPLVLKIILRWIFSWKIVFVTLGTHEKEILEQIWKAKNVKILSNCVDLKDASVFNRKPNGNGVRIGYLGRIDKDKGMLELMEACKSLSDSGVNYALDIAGKDTNNGKLISMFSQCLGDKFNYEGVISGEKKNKFLRRLDIFVLPSYYEGLPISLLESMSYGCACVVTPVGCIPEIIENGYNGVLVETRNSKSLYNALSSLCKDSALALKLGENAKALVFREFSPEKYFIELNRIYNRAMS